MKRALLLLGLACSLATAQEDLAEELRALIVGEDEAWAYEAIHGTRWLDPADAVRILRVALRSPRSHIRHTAAMQLAGCGSAALEAVPDLIQLGFDEWSTVRFAAIQTLGQLAQTAREAAPFLAEIGRGSDGHAGNARFALKAVGGGEFAAWSAIRGHLTGTGALEEDASPLALFDPGLRPALVAALSCDDWHAAGEAAALLERAGELAPPEVEALARAARHEQLYVRRHAARALATARALDALRALLHSDEVRLRGLALATIQEHQLADPLFAPDLLPLLGADDNWMAGPAATLLAESGSAAARIAPEIEARCLAGAIRPSFAARALAGIDPSAAEQLLLAASSSDDYEIRVDAVGAMNLLNSPRIAERLVEACFFDPTDTVPYALITLSRMGTAPLARLGVLVERLPRETVSGPTNEWARSIDPLCTRAGTTADAIRSNSVLASNDPQAWLAALASPDAATRARAARTASGREALPPEVRTALEGLLADPDWEVAGCAVRALATPEALQAGMRHEHAYVRWQAARTLAEQRRVDLLVALLEDPGYPHSVLLLRMLATLRDGAAPAVPALVARLDRDGFERVVVLETLRELGPAAAPALPRLLRLLREGGPYEIRAAAAALGAIGSPDAVPALVEVLRRFPALGVEKDLASIGEPAAAAVPLLVRMAQWRAGMGRNAIDALADMGPRGWAGLGEVLRNRDPVNRRHLTDLIRRKGAPDPGLIPVLEEIARDEADPLRGWALTLLARMGHMPEQDKELLLATLLRGNSTVPKLEQAMRGKFATQDLIGFLDHENALVRAASIRLLREKGTEAASALPRLGELLAADRVRYVREYAADAAVRIAGADAVPLLLAALESTKDRNLRKALGTALGGLGPEALPRLTAGLKNENGTVRYYCLRALGEMGPQAREALPDLLAMLETETRVERAVAEAIAAQGEAAIGPLLEKLADPRTMVQDGAGQALGLIGVAALPRLAAALDDERVAYRIAVARCLRRFGNAPEVTALLRAFLADPEPLVRGAAIQAFGSGRPGSLEVLVEAAASPLPEMRHEAATRLKRFQGEEAQVAIRALISLLGDPVTSIGNNAQSSLRNYGEAAKDELLRAFRGGSLATRRGVVVVLPALKQAGLPALREALADESADIRRVAAEMLERLGPDAAAAVPDLRRALRDPDVGVARQSAEALGDIGPAAREAIPDLMALLEGPVEQLRSHAGGALARLEAPLPPILALFDHEDERVREQAARTAGGFGVAARPHLLELLETGSVRQREMAVIALGSSRPTATTELWHALGDDAPSVRARAASIIASSPALREGSIPQLRAALGDTHVQVRMACMRALGYVGLAARDAFDEILALYTEPADEAERIAAREALASIGTAPAHAVELALDPDESIRQLGGVLLRNAGADGVRLVVERYADLPGERRGEVKEALVSLGETGAPEVAGLLAHERTEIRFDAAWILGQMGRRAAGAVPDLVEALHDAEKHVRMTAAWALGRIGPPASEALPALRELARKEPDLAATALDAIARISSG